MAKNWAIAIGVNQYEFLQPLRYAKRDAELMRHFLEQDAGFDRIFFFSDDSPQVNGKSTRPFGSNILRVLRQVFETPFMGDGDNFWFFFSGHGIRHNERDYLMPLDGDPEAVERTGISTHYITERLRRCGADNVVMILDACRSEGRKSGIGIGQQTEEESRQTGVISIFSCSPEQYSYEIESIGQGAFTCALLEGLGIRGRCSTVERLNQYLERRVPEIVNQHHSRVRQVPYAIAEPLSRSHLILMPQYASLTDIAILKNDAARAERRREYDLAQRLWIRVLAAASGQDMDAIEALQQIAVLRAMGQIQPNLSPSLDSLTGGKSGAESADDGLTLFSLQSATLVARQTSGSLGLGEKLEWEIRQHNQTARGFVESLVGDVSLEMVQVPSGSFWMGQTESETQELICQFGKEKYQQYFAYELPRHQVNVSSFFMGRAPVTQAQYEAVMGTNPAMKYDNEKFVAPNKPVVGVSWNDAIAFCERLSEQTGNTYRLPSEAEWEYACRAGTTTPFYFGETITPDLANYDGNYTYGSGSKGIYRQKTTDVGSFPANRLGLYDMHGNVWEWCFDQWHKDYQGAPADGNPWNVDGEGDYRIVRGGSWYNDPRLCRSASRYRNDPDFVNNDIGFRVSCSPPRAVQ
ncbi:MAG: SUMF1/EgtB/PvdO family nonheme iron enzyme [Elainellaceae cyanobacterium]